MSLPLPPPQPAYILRGHASQVHCLSFSPSNASLLSADASGYAVAWSLSTKRAWASWRPHSSAVLGVAWWSEMLVVTHGRDSKLHVWGLWTDPGAVLDSVLPVDRIENPGPSAGNQPVLLHSLTVNTLNFCAFAWCWDSADDQANCKNSSRPGDLSSGELAPDSSRTERDQQPSESKILLALPHTLDSEATDVYTVSIPMELLPHRVPHTPINTAPALPSGSTPTSSVTSSRLTTLQPPSLSNPKTGLTMCLSIPNPSTLIAGYESGHTIVYSLSESITMSTSQATHQETPAVTKDSSASFAAAHADRQYAPIYVCHPHSQPVLSLAPSPGGRYYVTTSADALVARHCLPGRTLPASSRSSDNDTQEPSTSSSPGRITKVGPETGTETELEAEAEVLSPFAQAAREAHTARKATAETPNQGTPKEVTEQPPESILNTKHPGQQGIAFRDDGLIFATAGWDGRGRVYRGGEVSDAVGDREGREAETGTADTGGAEGRTEGRSKGKGKGQRMKELAVLKWHKEGCYCSAFAHVAVAAAAQKQLPYAPAPVSTQYERQERLDEQEDRNSNGNESQSQALAPTRGSRREISRIGVDTGFKTVAQRREEKALATHWLALGSKDGKVSLWDVF